MDLRQSREWGKYLESLGWATKVVGGGVLRIKKLGPLGSIIKIQRPDELLLDEIDQFARKNKAFLVKIEPISEAQARKLRSKKYSPDNWPLTPSRSVVIDLTKSEEVLLKDFSKDARQSLRKSSYLTTTCRIFNFTKPFNDDGTADDNHQPKAHGSTYPVEGLKTFYRIWRETGRRRNFWVPTYLELFHKVQAFGDKAVLILAENNLTSETFQQPEPERLRERQPPPGAAGCLLFITERTAYYHHAASTNGGQSVYAPYAVLWQAIRESKKRGCLRFDLEGIFDLRFPSMRRWVSFSAFKLKWGGEVLEYPPSYTKIYNPFLKLLFRLTKQF